MNLVGHVGPLAKKHDSGMRSFDLRCTSYNPEASGKYKSTEFMLRCFFDIGKRWEAYEPPHAGTLAHIIGQLIGCYKMGHDEKPAVLITDFKVLLSSRNTSTVSSMGASSPETTIPRKRRYGPQSSIVHTSPVTPTRSRSSIETNLFSESGLGDMESPNRATASLVSRQDEEPLSSLLEEAETVSLTADEQPELLEIEDPVLDSQQQRPKRMKTRKRGMRGDDSLDI